MTDIELFLKLAKPENGVSRVISKKELVNEYSTLNFTNGCQWMRGLKGKFLYETQGRGDSWTIKLNGIDSSNESRGIRTDIRKKILTEKCVHTGFRGTTQNPIEVDHKNGRYNESNVLDLTKQSVTDFQPLCRQGNLQKRSDCKKCKQTGNRFDARELGYSVSVVKYDLTYNGTCEGCYWYDPSEFKKKLII